MRTTHALVQVTAALLDNPRGRHWGYDLSKAAGVRSGVLYPMLTRFLEEGWVEDGWEDETIARTEKRPARRYYQLTDEGIAQLGALMRRAQVDPRFTWLQTRFA